MSYQLIEYFVQGKADDPLVCEDRIVCTDSFVAVVDGVTSKSEKTFDGKSPGLIAGELISNVIQETPIDSTMYEFIDAVNRSFQEFYKRNGIAEQVVTHPEDRLSASAVIYSNHSRMIWIIGDCQALVAGKFITNRKKVDLLFSELRSFILKTMIMKGATVQQLLENDRARQSILPLMIKQYVFQNNPVRQGFSYAVLDGFPVDPVLVKEIEVPPKSTVILSSDGYPRLYKTLKTTEQYLRELLRKDPLCYRMNKSTKGKTPGQVSYDDRAYIKFKTGE